MAEEGKAEVPAGGAGEVAGAARAREVAAPAARGGGGALVRGRAWKFGDNVDTDAIIPARYLNTSDPAELARHCMEDADPSF
ncbi:MAG: hypothetical protein QJR13_05070, partial [Bacillota bacterium]|nr:hypothetical protein [Bacillota bacterium]